MNLHGIAGPAVAAVNPQVPVRIQISTGYTTEATGRRVPTYAPPITRMAQVQPLTFRDLQQIEGLNLQGERRGIYLFGHIDGIVRQESKGGDLITLPDDSVWLVAMILEDWPDWVKAAITRQNT